MSEAPGPHGARAGRASDLALSPDTTGLALVDIQERLAAAMPADALRETVRNAGILIEAAKRLGLPILVSEQYPAGLGPTLPELAARLEGVPPDRLARVEKVEFDCSTRDAWTRFVESTGRRRWVLTGMEAHVCVYQTARGLVGRGVTVHVPRDAVTSRVETNRETGLRLCERAGAVVTSTEVVLFDLLGRAGTDEFRALAKLVR